MPLPATDCPGVPIHKMNVIRLLDAPIAFHRCLVTVTGSVTGALFMSQAIYWQNRAKRPDGWWYLTAADWMEQTGLTRHELAGAKRACSKLVDSMVKGVPATTWYKVDAEKLMRAIEQIGGELSLPKSGKPVRRNPANQFSENRQTSPPESGKLLGTENNPETTQRVSADAESRVAPAQARELVSLFARAFKVHHGVDYGVKAVDATWASRLISIGVTPAQAATTVSAAWTRDGFNGRRAKTVRMLYELWNEVLAEASRGRANQPILEGGGLEELAAELNSGGLCQT